MKKFDLKRLAAIIYALAITAMAFLFFTNDFGLVDIRKTAVIIGAGIDLTEGGVSVTAQVAVPQPSENGENTVYIEVEGDGATVADALNVINKKTGFFPKLVFCKLLILGESCRDADIFEVLDYFYRDDYTQLTPVIAMCSGSAGELLASKMRFGNTATVSIERLLSDEAKKSANVSTVNLKMIGIDNFSQSAACYMPYIRARAQSAASPAAQSTGGGGQSEGQSGGEEGGDMQEFLCDRTAIFRGGRFAGILDEEQTFALNLLKNSVRHVFVPCTYEGTVYTLGLRNCRGGAGVRSSGGGAVARLAFSAVVQVSDVGRAEDPRSVSEGVVPEGVLRAGEARLRGLFSSLFSALREADCDALELGTKLFRYDRALYEELEGRVLSSAQLSFEVSLRSAG